MHRYHSPDDLARAVRQLVKQDNRFASILKMHGMPSLRQGETGLAGLLMIVTEQFLSLQAASAIWSKIASALSPIGADRLLATSHEDLLALGLSNAKAKSFHGIARAVADNQLNFETLNALSDNEVRQKLLALPGVGPWTADIYLLSNLQRCDAWPVGDLALQYAAQNLLGLNDRPDPKQMTLLAEAWRPHRAAAARLLWSHYRGMKGLKQAV